MDNTQLTIGFDAKRIVANATGLGSYGRNLLNDLAHVAPQHRYLLLAPDKGKPHLYTELATHPCIRLATSGHRNRIIQAVWRSFGIRKDIQRNGIRLFHGLSGELPIGIRHDDVKTVMTVHDLIFMRHPEFYHPLDAWIYKQKFYRSVREADRIVAISERTRRDIIELTRYPADRIDVVYQSCSTAFKQKTTISREVISQKYGLPKRYILCVGTIEPRKNALTALRATAALDRDVALVLVGRRTPYTQQVIHEAKQLGMQQRLFILNGIGNDELPAIYQYASAFIYPSRYEGFGIPIIEAIQSGLPVVAATGSCLEEAGGPHCQYAHPDDAEAFAACLRKCLTEDQTQRIQHSREYVTRFENSNVGRQMLDEYEKTMQQPKYVYHGR